MATERNDHHDRYWRISVWIDKALEEPVRQLAEQRGMKVNALVTRLLTIELREAGLLPDDRVGLPSAPAIVDQWMTLGVPIRAAKALARAGVSPEAAAAISDADLKALPSIGPWAIDAARAVVPAPAPAVERFHAERLAAATAGDATIDPTRVAASGAPDRRPVEAGVR